MATKKIKQFVYSYNNLITELGSDHNILLGYTPVIALGVQATPGSKICINQGGPIEIGEYGIYELDLTNGIGYITSLAFLEIQEPQSEQFKFIVDIMYYS